MPQKARCVSAEREALPAARRIATFSQIAAKELIRYDVKSNTIAPGARTRLTLATPGLEDIMKPAEGSFDQWDPANISPLVAYLASVDCKFTGETFFVQGGNVTYMRRDSLRDGDKVKSHAAPRDSFITEAPQILTDIQVRLYREARTRLDSNIHSGAKRFAEL